MLLNDERLNLRSQGRSLKFIGPLIIIKTAHEKSCTLSHSEVLYIAFACPLSASGKFICRYIAEFLRLKIGIGLNKCHKSCSQIWGIDIF